MIKLKEKYKINLYGLLDLQFAFYGIKMNSEVPRICQKIKIISCSQILSKHFTDSVSVPRQRQ